MEPETARPPNFTRCATRLSSETRRRPETAGPVGFRALTQRLLSAIFSTFVLNELSFDAPVARNRETGKARHSGGVCLDFMSMLLWPALRWGPWSESQAVKWPTIGRTAATERLDRRGHGRSLGNHIAAQAAPGPKAYNAPTRQPTPDLHRERPTTRAQLSLPIFSTSSFTASTLF